MQTPDIYRPTEHGFNTCGKTSGDKDNDSILIIWGNIREVEIRVPARSRRPRFWGCQIGRGRFGNWPSAPPLTITVIPDTERTSNGGDGFATQSLQRAASYGLISNGFAQTGHCHRRNIKSPLHRAWQFTITVRTESKREESTSYFLASLQVRTILAERVRCRQLHYASMKQTAAGKLERI